MPTIDRSKITFSTTGRVELARVNATLPPRDALAVMNRARDMAAGIGSYLVRADQVVQAEKEVLALINGAQSTTRRK